MSSAQSGSGTELPVPATQPRLAFWVTTGLRFQFIFRATKSNVSGE